MKKILNLIYLCIDSFANWIHFKVYKSKRRTCQCSISSSKNEFNKIKNFKNSIIYTEYEKSFNYDGHSFLYFCNNSTNIKIKPLTYTDLLYLNKIKKN